MKPELLEMKSDPGEKATEWKTKCEKISGGSVPLRITKQSYHEMQRNSGKKAAALKTKSSETVNLNLKNNKAELSWDAKKFRQESSRSREWWKCTMKNAIWEVQNEKWDDTWKKKESRVTPSEEKYSG